MPTEHYPTKQHTERYRLNRRQVDVMLHDAVTQLRGRLRNTHGYGPMQLLVVGIGRGGRYPAAYVAEVMQAFSLMLPADVMDSNSDAAFGIQTVFNARLADLSPSVSCIIVVDDITDTGKTLEVLGNFVGWERGVLVHRLTVCAKTSAIERLKYCNFFYGHEFQDSDWVIFPWEDGEND